MNSQHILGIDNGGTVAKAALFSLDGRELGVASRRTEPLTPKPGWVEFDAERLWQATAAAVRQVLADTHIDPRSIAAVACTGHGNGLYLVDDRGLPVRNAIFSSDTRAQSYVDRWMSDGIDRVVRPQTMQALWPGQPNALLAWLRDHEPDALRRASWILMCKDYVRCRLTGQALAELTDMSGTSLLDVGTERYDSARPGSLRSRTLARKAASATTIVRDLRRDHSGGCRCNGIGSRHTRGRRDVRHQRLCTLFGLDGREHPGNDVGDLGHQPVRFPDAGGGWRLHDMPILPSRLLSDPGSQRRFGQQP